MSLQWKTVAYLIVSKELLEQLQVTKLSLKGFNLLMTPIANEIYLAKQERRYPNLSEEWIDIHRATNTYEFGDMIDEVEFVLNE